MQTLRDAWIREASPLSLCDCESHPTRRRIEIENQIVQELSTRIPPSIDQRLSILSIGAGDLLQDYLLIKRIEGYRIDLVIVEPHLSEGNLDKLQSLVGEVDLRILAISKIKNLEVKSLFHCIHAIDFQLVCNKDRKAWKILNLARQHLAPNGMMFCSASFSDYTFNHQTGWHFNLHSDFKKIKRVMNMGVEIADKFPSSSKINCLAVSSFGHTLGVIYSLVSKGISDISFSFLYKDEDDVGLNCSSDRSLEHMTQHMFPIAKIVFRSISQIDEKEPFNAIIDNDKAVINDSNFSLHGQQLKATLDQTGHCAVKFIG